MKEKLFNNFAMCFPSTAAKAVRYYPSGKNDLIVTLNDGSRILYDDIDETIRNLPKNADRLTEAECRDEFGRRLRKVMHMKGVTQREMSEITGIPQPVLSDYITGKRMPSFYKVDKIAKALRCSMDELRYV